MKKILSLLLVLSFSLTSVAFATELPPLDAKSYVLTDINGNILYEHNMHEKLQPASVTKVMTMLLVMEAIESGILSYDDIVTVSQYASSMGGSQVFLSHNEQMTVRDILKCIVVASANDASVAIAEHISGSESAFVELMNSRALELGMLDTTFINANGLDADDVQTITSAHDLALASAQLLKHEDIKEFSTIWMDTIRDGTFTLANTNKMLKSYNGLTGLKTGYIQKAGYCISATAERDGLELIAVVMSSPTIEARTSAVASLLNHGFANYANFKPEFLSNEHKVPVYLGTEDYITGRIDEVPNVVVDKNKLSEITYSIIMEESITAPVLEGQKIGNLIVLSGSEQVLDTPIYADHSIEKLSIFDIFVRLLGNFCIM